MLHHSDILQSKQIYRIEHWGEGLFDINKNGELTVSSNPNRHVPVSLHRIAQELNKQGLSCPMLVRFPDILLQRVHRLRDAFAKAIYNEQYSGRYTLVYPIKVNQQRSVVEAIANSGQIGLEAGSKSEMMAILALSLSAGSIVTCNGYKDREYVRMALTAQEIGLQLYIIVEKFSELNLIAEEAERLNIVPRLGIRVKLASVGQGKWQDSGGEKSKFGLNSSQLLDAVQQAKKLGLLKSLQLMHFHVGSQIPNIRDIQKILSEAARFYAELKALGTPIQVVNAGGGLGVDYEGTLSNRHFSKNYTMEEYANNIIYTFKEICRSRNLPEPDIITETGRAITAHHAVLITNIIDAESAVSGSVAIHPPSDKEPDIIQDLWNQLNNINSSSALEIYHNAVYWLNEAYIMFSYGVIDLRQRAQAEQLVYNIFLKVRGVLEGKAGSGAYHRALDELNDKLADKYFANFSLFASAPDAWAIKQLFPVVPLHRLDEYPTRRATLHDLTCDSDGQFKQYVHSCGPDTSLPVHSLSADDPYLIGVFLVGAYQEILGDIHNLFGTPHAVTVHLTEQGTYEFSDLLKGDSVRDILGYVHYDTKRMQEELSGRLQKTPLQAEQRRFFMRNIDAVLEQSTYFHR